MYSFSFFVEFVIINSKERGIMKKWKICFFLSFFFLIIDTNASCKPGALKEISYLQGDYQTIGYCSVERSNLQTGGCMPTAYAMLVANLSDSSVTPVTIRDEICNSSLKSSVRGASGNGPGQASYMLGTSSDAVAVAQKYNIHLERYSSREIEDIKTELKNGSMFIASIKCPSPGKGHDVSGCRFTSSASGHYVVLSNVDSENHIVVLNPGNRATAQQAWSDSEIYGNILNVINQGLWKATGTSSNCSKVTGSGGSSGGSSSGTTTPTKPGSTEDKYPNFFPDLDTDSSCGTIFVNCDGEFNEFGEFLNRLFLLMKILAPALVLILSTVDYVKAILNSNADEMKKVNERTVKRAVVGLIVFFLPFLLELLFHIFGLYDISTHGIGS